jgi:hypothetical protein
MEHISSWSVQNEVNMLGESMKTTMKNTEALLEASREVVLEVNTEKIKYMPPKFRTKS